MDEKNLEIFKNLFKGREDVFALHLKKGKRGVYMPAYHFDPYIYRLYKAKGGTFRDFPQKTFKPLTGQEIIKHLNGEQHLGLYPLLQDNTSWFIVADFDKKEWEKEARVFVRVCKKYGLTALLERSRSGNGGHVWLFFEEPYQAFRSRKIVISLMKEACVFSEFGHDSSFDRLFPIQDAHSGKGLGNLIALPLYKRAVDEGNCFFIDAESEPYLDQWEILATIRKITVSRLEEIYQNQN